MGKKEFPAALERVQAILEGDPDHHEALYLEYQVRLELKDLSGALEVISRAITRGGGRPEYRIERARLFAQLGHEEAAEKDLDWLEGKGFMIGEVSAVRGEIAVDRGNMARAVDWFQRAEANQYTQPDLYLARARAYLSQKRYGRSIEDLDRVFRQKNLSLSIQAEASYVRGRARTEEGRELSSAREDLEAAGAMGYDASGMDQYFLGRIDLKEGKPKPARERFEALVRSGMTHPQIRYFLAQSYFELGNVKESHRVVTEAIHQSPFQARFFRLRGKCRLQLEQFEGAEEDLDKALALDVEDFEPLVGLFFSYIGQGRFDRCLDMQGLVNNLYGRGWNEPVSLFDPRSTDFLSRYVEGYVFEQPRVKLLKGEAEARKLYARYVWALESSDKTVRQAAIGALRGAGEVMVPLLEQQREEASQELQKVLDEALDGIEEDRRARLRHELSARLVKFYIGRDASSFEFLEKGGKSVIDRLDSLFLDTTEERVLRDLAARALLDLRMPTAFAKLVSACGSKDPFVAIVATDYMYGAGFASSFQRLLSFFEDKDPRIRALAVQRTPFMPSEVQRWRDRLQDADHRVRVQAARRLALRGDRSGISALMQSLKSNETEVRRVGIRGLGHLKGKDSVAALSVMIEDDEPSLRRDAVVALSQQGISNAVGLMKLVERETRNDIRAMALLAIARTKDKRARSMMHEILFNDEANVIERGAALLYFSATNDFLVVGELPQLLQSRDRLARMVALFSMGMYTRDFAKGKIIENLKHEDSAIRAAAATSLAYCSGDDVRDALWKRVDDPSVIVASVAAGSLTYLFYQKGIEFPDLFERLKSKPWYVRRGTGFGLHRLATIHPKNISAKSAKEREAIRRQILTRALDWIPEMPELYRDLSLSLRGAGEVDQALRVLGRGLRKHPDEIDLLFERGQAYFSKKDWSRALEDFQRVTEVDRKRVDAWFYAGEAERKRNRYASAIDHYDKVFFLRPSHAAALTRQAEMLRLLKRDDAVRWTDLHGMSHRYLSWGRLHWEVARHRARKKMVNDCLFHLEQAKKGNVDVGKAATLPEFSFLVSDSNFQRLTK
jgi:tetratricopeptide (TPR) repeat protein